MFLFHFIVDYGALLSISESCCTPLALLNSNKEKLLKLEINSITFLKKFLFRRVIGHTVLSQSSYSIFLCLYLLKKSIFNPSFLYADIHPCKKEATLTTLELRNAQLLPKYIWYVLGALRNTVAKVCFFVYLFM